MYERLLTDKQKAAYRMRHVHGMTDGQIARATGTRRESVNRMLARTREKVDEVKSLILALGGHYDEDEVIRTLLGDRKAVGPAQAKSALTSLRSEFRSATDYALTA